MREHWKRYVSSILFVVLQSIFYVTFLVLDLTKDNVKLSSYIKFGVIIICFWFALFWGKSANRKQLLYLRIALFLTVISDLFILLLDVYFYGVLTFLIVQQLYSLRIDQFTYEDDQNNNKNNNKHNRSPWGKRFIILGFITLAIALFVDLSGIYLDSVLVITIFYFTNLIYNVMRSIRTAYRFRVRTTVFFALGMFLFLLCDINVGLFNLSSYINLPFPGFSFVYELSSILMWTFYAPSQVLIALSSKE